MLRVARNAVQVHGVVWGLPYELEARHDHPRHPEEQDVGSAHEHVGRVERPKVRRVLRPAEGGERPQPRREPRVEHILVLAHRSRTRRAGQHVLAAYGPVSYTHLTLPTSDLV